MTDPIEDAFAVLIAKVGVYGAEAVAVIVSMVVLWYGVRWLLTVDGMVYDDDGNYGPGRRFRHRSHG